MDVNDFLLLNVLRKAWQTGLENGAVSVLIRQHDTYFITGINTRSSREIIAGLNGTDGYVELSRDIPEGVATPNGVNQRVFTRSCWIPSLSRGRIFGDPDGERLPSL